MDILKRIRDLMEERDWSIYRLAIESGLTQSTISNMFNRKTDPSIKTLEALCDAFHITLSDFFREEEGTPIDLQKKELLESFSRLSQKERDALLTLVRSLGK